MLNVDSLAVEYPARSHNVRAIDDISFVAEQGEFLSIVGPSGCGKSTLLQCLAGLRVPTSGTVRIDGDVVSRPHPEMTVVFQEYGRSLFPWLTVEANVALPLEQRRMSRPERRRAAGEALQRVALGDVGRLYPWQLSGGMQQRVAIARALVVDPSLLLMDEPFASVDAQTRIELEDLLLGIWKESGTTVVFITHDIDEAVYMSTRVLALSPRPSRVLREVPVDLPRPRHQVHTKRDPEYQRIRSELLDLILHDRVARPAPETAGDRSPVGLGGSM